MCSINFIRSLSLLTALFRCPNVVNGDDPIVYLTSTSSLKGYTVAVNQTHYQGNVNVFLGVPYAEPPFGKLRFAPPQPAKLWLGQRVATKFRAGCPQVTKSTISEDCLYLNVFAPPGASKLPVMLWIYGGGFMKGRSSTFLPQNIADNLASRGVVVVTFNYRLGAFGFFSTRTSDSPGNYALYDSTLILSWIQRFISNFGGDPAKVTVFGQSAGAEMLSTLTFSPKTKGLFHQFILQSGSAYVPAIVSETEFSRNTSKMLALSLNCATELQWDLKIDMQNVMDCMRAKTMTEVFDASEVLNTHRIPFGPVLDGPDGFIPAPINILQRSRPPYKSIMGVCHDEYLFFYLRELLENSNFPENFTSDSVANNILTRNELAFYKHPDLVSQGAILSYLTAHVVNGVRDSDHLFWVEQAIRVFTDWIFVGAIPRDAAELIKVGGSVHMYSMDWLNSRALTESPVRGVPHEWDLQYLFAHPGYAPHDHRTPSSYDWIMVNYFGAFWTNFAKTGNPTPNGKVGSNLPALIWAKHDPSKMTYLSLHPHPPLMKTGFHPLASGFFSHQVPGFERL